MSIRNRHPWCLSLVLAAVAFGLLAIQPAPVQARGFFRLFRQCPPPRYYQAPAQSSNQAIPPGSYQSFSYEPGPANPAPTYVAPRPSSGTQFYNSIRGDRKALGRNN
ncbi:MAG: hypothetical protein JSS49_21470 [Planctomycetes bacterium]|nr:hypothetical protein [Planctomycetota bacterium]